MISFIILWQSMLSFDVIMIIITLCSMHTHVYVALTTFQKPRQLVFPPMPGFTHTTGIPLWIAKLMNLLSKLRYYDINCGACPCLTFSDCSTSPGTLLGLGSSLRSSLTLDITGQIKFSLPDFFAHRWGNNYNTGGKDFLGREITPFS